MQLGPVGNGFEPLAATLKATSVQQLAGIAANLISAGGQLDSVLLNTLSASDKEKLSTLLENGVLAGKLMDQMQTAIDQQDPVLAARQLQLLSKLDPLVQQAAAAHPESLAEFAALPARVLTAAKIQTESRIGKAAELIEQAPEKRLSGWDLAPQALLHIAQQIAHVGSYASTVQARDIAEAVLLWFPDVPVPLPVEDTAGEPKRGTVAKSAAVRKLALLGLAVAILLLILLWRQ